MIDPLSELEGPGDSGTPREGHPDAPGFAAVLGYPCPTCKAPAGALCASLEGVEFAFHRVRLYKACVPPDLTFKKQQLAGATLHPVAG